MTFSDRSVLEDRLINWARWCRDSKARGRCGSAESKYNYRSDMMDGDEVMLLEKPVAVGVVDHQDALAVNRAWQRLPLLNNRIIAAHYIPLPKDRHHKAMCKSLGLRLSEYDEKLMRSQQMLFNLLAHSKM